MLQAEAPLVVGSQQTLKLITAGRLTGLPHVAELRYVILDRAFCVLAGDSKSDWVRNALSSKSARAKVGELVYNVSSSSAPLIEQNRVLDSFRRKYGSRIVDQWYRHPQACLRLDPFGAPSKRGAVRSETETQINFLEWRRRGADYCQSIEDAFDSASEEYDYTISHNYINSWIRKRSIRELLKLAGPDDVLLEIGCGTGAEAIQITSHVAGIVATDISEKMLEILRRKVLARRLGRKIIAVRSRASDVSDVKQFLPNGKTRITYSFNGALNCEPGLDRVPQQLSRVLEDKGYFLCSIRNTLCLPEVVSHSLVLQFDKTTSRKIQPTMVSVGGMDIPSYYYSPETFSRLFRPYFEVRRIIGLPAFLPPAYLNDYYLRTGVMRLFLEKLELVLGGRFPFNRLGDQTLFVFQKA